MAPWREALVITQSRSETQEIRLCCKQCRLRGTSKALCELCSRLSRPQGFQGGAILVVGAGVNGGLVATWDELLRNLLQRLLCARDPATNPDIQGRIAAFQNHFDIYAQASLVESILGPAQLRRRLASIIYQDPERVLAGSRLLHAVADFCGKGVIRAVLTFNYDSYLEQTLMTRGITRPFLSIDCLDDHRFTSAGSPRPGDDLAATLPIYHVHGLIPEPRRVLRQIPQPIVLSQADYLAQFRLSEGMATSTPLHLLRSYQAIFIGCSLKDWNMIRLLRNGGNRQGDTHYGLIRSFQPESGMTADDCATLDQLQDQLWKSFGVTAIYVDHHDQLPDVVNTLKTHATAR